jgi:hypothetical protein
MSRGIRVHRRVRRSRYRPVLYSCDDFVGQGTVLDMSETNCRFAGCTSVLLGMRLRLCVLPSRTPDDMWVNHTTVTGAKGRQVGIFCMPHVWGIRLELNEACAGPLWRWEPVYRSTGCSERALFD